MRFRSRQSRAYRAFTWIGVSINFLILAAGFTLIHRQQQKLEITNVHAALSRQDIKQVRAWIEDGRSVEAADDGGNTLLIEAAIWRDHDIISLLLQHGAKVNARDSVGVTPLMNAASTGDVWEVQRFLERGALVNAADNDDGTALLRSVFREGRPTSRYATVKLLLEHGASVHVREKNGETPLAKAEHYHAPNIAALLQSYGETE